MKRALLTLLFIGGFVCTTTVANAQSLEPVAIRSDQAEIHSVVVDMPRIISLPPASPEAWETWWLSSPSAGPLNGQLLQNGQLAQNRLHASTW